MDSSPTQRRSRSAPDNSQPPPTLPQFEHVSRYWDNQHHCFAPNALKRHSIGTKNKALQYNPDGSLTIYVQADPPAETQRGNWLPAPAGADFSLYLRAYWPKVEITDGTWTPPAVEPQGAGVGARALQWCASPRLACNGGRGQPRRLLPKSVGRVR